MFFLSRLVNLVRGSLREWLARRERRSPAAVYEAAIAERLAHYTKLREAAASILYLRNKLGRQLEEARRALAATHQEIGLAVDRDDDEAAIFLIERKDRLTADVERVNRDLAELTGEADIAKKNLAAFQKEIETLREEKTRTLARLANAEARLRLQHAVNGIAGITPDADIQALEGVREYVERTVAEAAQARESGDESLDARLAAIRADQADRAARAELAELKRRRRGLLLPLVIPERERAAVR